MKFQIRSIRPSITPQSGIRWSGIRRSGSSGLGLEARKLQIQKGRPPEIQIPEPQAESSTKGYHRARALWFVAALSLAVAGCSGQDTAEAKDVASSTADADLAFTDGQPDETDSEESASQISQDTVVTADSSVVTTTTVPSEDAATSATSGSGMAPVTTIQGRVVGDPQNLYSGVIGKLGLNEVVVESDIAPPAVAQNVMPLTGEVAGANGVPKRPAAVVKIDNGSPAAPQVGLNSADIVIEEEVEGGVTRFAAIFHSKSSIVGPVRSGRSTDISLISSLGTPLLMYSGANDVTEHLLRQQTQIQNRSFEISSGYWRDSARRAPSNLFTDTEPHWASATGSPPSAQFAYAAADTVDGSTSGFETQSFAVNYPSSSAAWRWDGRSWLRSQRGRPHVLQSGKQVSAANVVVIEAERVATGLVDSAGGEVPEFVFVGTGDATVFVNGKRISGTWTRPTLASVATIVGTDGSLIELSPGRTWIQLIESDSGFLQADS